MEAEMRQGQVMAAALLAALAAPAMAGGAEVVHRGFGFAAPTLEPRRSGYRRGRRFDHRGRAIDRNGNRPAGSKLAKKAARGKLTIVGIR
jgi:hypothetical protein